MNSSDSENAKTNVLLTWENEHARNLGQFLSVKGLTYVPNNPESLPGAAGQFLGDELFQLFVVQPNLYHNRNSNEYKTSPK
jgi:hypothetical protein